MRIWIFLFRAFDRRLARLAAPISSGGRQGGRICPPAGRVRLNTSAGRGLKYIICIKEIFFIYFFQYISTFQFILNYVLFITYFDKKKYL